jgi:renalase
MAIAVVGAGIAGIAAARALVAAGREVALFDKGRAAGGRVATRRTAGFAFDHGAQLLARADDGLGEAWLAAGGAAWPAGGGLVGVPGMSAVPRALAAGLPLHASRHVVGLRPTGDGWIVEHHDAAVMRPGAPPPDNAPEAAGPFEAVLCLLPAPQAAALLRPVAPAVAEAAGAVRFSPCWTVMAAFAKPLPLPDTLREPDHAIGWAARDSAKPGRAAAECWVVQAGPTWSEAHLEAPAEQACGHLLDALARHAGPLPGLLHAEAHRWRFAVAAEPLGRACLWDPAARLGVGGDWCLGDRIEHAWRSGRALAAEVLATGRAADA